MSGNLLEEKIRTVTEVTHLPFAVAFKLAGEDNWYIIEKNFPIRIKQGDFIKQPLTYGYLKAGASKPTDVGEITYCANGMNIIIKGRIVKRLEVGDIAYIASYEKKYRNRNIKLN